MSGTESVHRDCHPRLIPDFPQFVTFSYPRRAKLLYLRTKLPAMLGVLARNTSRGEPS
jgi:hypothetical protein